MRGATIRTMPQNQPKHSEFLKALGRSLTPGKPLQPNSPYYEPVYEKDPGDPIELIRSDITFAEVESVNFISGFRGSGKTTELFRLKERLEEDGHYVAYANALDYMPPSAAIDVSDFLINLARAFSDAVEDDAGFDPKHQRWWTRVVH
jgi:hypothetical protein